MDVLFGLETEYGITRDDPTGLDVVSESISLVRAAHDEGVRMKWDYSCEDPHLDQRGFRVRELRQDTDEADYQAEDEARPLSFTEIKSDLVLKNGARFYNDHAHPEYCTPECSMLHELLQQDFMGDQLVMTCARAVSEESKDGNRVRIYKNNTDFLGHSYGCHENYLVPRRLEWSDLSRSMIAFLVTRQIYAGTGKYGQEDEDKFVGPGFQISQRGDFFRVLESVDTMQRRPIVNTRDEPHADREKWRRFHVICGDANMSPFSTFLKVGTTAAVLEALSNGAPLDTIPTVADPVPTIRTMSRDRSWKWECKLANGKTTTGIEIQRHYIEMVKQFANMTDECRLVVNEWERAINDLDKDPLLTSDRLDWTAKYELIETFRENEGVPDNDPWLQSLDLAYHLLDRQEGLFFALIDQGSIKYPYENPPIAPTSVIAPPTTRAAIRGELVKKFGDQIVSAQWDHVRLRDGETRVELDLTSAFDQAEISKAVKVISTADNLNDIAKAPFAKLKKG